MSVGGGVVRSRGGRGHSGRGSRPWRRNGAELDAGEGQQMPVWIFRAVEHEAVAGAGGQGRRRRDEDEHAAFGGHHLDGLESLRTAERDGGVGGAVHAKGFGEAKRDRAVHENINGARYRERRRELRWVGGE